MRARPRDQVHVSQRCAVAPNPFESASSGLEVPRASYIECRCGRGYTKAAGDSENLIAILSGQRELSREQQAGGIEANEFAYGCRAKICRGPATGYVKAHGIGRTSLVRSSREANQREVDLESVRVLVSFITLRPAGNAQNRE